MGDDELGLVLVLGVGVGLVRVFFFSCLFVVDVFCTLLVLLLFSIIDDKDTTWYVWYQSICGLTAA